MYIHGAKTAGLREPCQASAAAAILHVLQFLLLQPCLFARGQTLPTPPPPKQTSHVATEIYFLSSLSYPLWSGTESLYLWHISGPADVEKATTKRLTNVGNIYTQNNRLQLFQQLGLSLHSFTCSK